MHASDGHVRRTRARCKFLRMHMINERMMDCFVGNSRPLPNVRSMQPLPRVRPMLPTPPCVVLDNSEQDLAQVSLAQVALQRIINPCASLDKCNTREAHKRDSSLDSVGHNVSEIQRGQQRAGGRVHPISLAYGSHRIQRRPHLQACPRHSVDQKMVPDFAARMPMRTAQ